MSRPEALVLATAMLQLMACTAWRDGARDDAGHRRVAIAPRLASPEALAALHLQDGDLAFRRTTGMLGQVVRASDRAGDFSHVGIVRLTEHGPMVVHATPDGGQGHDGVVVDLLAQYMEEPGTDAVGFYRYRIASTGAMQRLADARAATVSAHATRWAVEAAARRVPFDGALDLSDSSAVYCTELVWRAFASAGVELAAPTTLHPHVPLGPRDILLVSSLQSSPQLVRLAMFAAPNGADSHATSSTEPDAHVQSTH